MGGRKDENIGTKRESQGKVYRGEEVEVGRLSSWIKGEEGQSVFQGEATAFKSLELEILGDILGGRKDEKVETTRESEVNIMVKPNQRIRPSNQLLCPVVGCDLAFGSREGMRHHLKTDHCKTNGFTNTKTKIDGILDFKVEREMFLPVKNHKEVIKRAQTDIDTERDQTSTRENLLCPEASQSKMQRLNCPHLECSNDFVNRAIMLKHLKIEHVSDQIDCKVCGTFYKDVYYLKKHNARKHSSQELQCDQCDYRTSMMEDLKKHMDSKHDPKRYPCEFCGKDFATGRGLDVT